MSCIAFLLLTLSLPAQNGDPAQQAWDAWLAGDFARVEQIAHSAAADTTLKDSQRARIYLALGSSRAMRGRDTDAREAFRLALSFDPALNPTSSDLPPPAWKLFAPLRDEFAASSPVPASTDTQPQKPVAPTTSQISKPEPAQTQADGASRRHSTSQALKSLLLPGWGHISDGRSRGWLIAGTNAALLAGLVASSIEARDARDAYLKARAPSDIEARYDTYNKWHQTSWGLGIAWAAVYMATQLDYFTGTPHLPLKFTLNEDKISLGVAVNCEL